MTREEAKATLKQKSLAEQFSLTRKGKQYVCPLCGSGSGPNKTAAFTIYPDNTYKCFACNASGDIFTLYQALNNLPAGPDGFRQALEELSAKNGLAIDQIAAPPKKDLSRYFEECQARLTSSPEAVSYLESRKISTGTASAFGIGYDPAADPAEAHHPAKRIIIPTSKEHYIARAIDPKEQIQKLNNKGAVPAIWNAAALYGTASEVFVVEGIFDALSIIEAGGEAIALNSTSNRAKLLEAIREKKPKCKLILCLDNDEAGKRASDLLQSELKSEGLSFICADICCGKKDPNEALTNCEGRFREAVKKAIAEAQKPDNTSLFLERFFQTERDRASGQIPTGFPDLDNKTGGGLYTGLYIFAAGTSIGKTTFCLQMADNMAEAGQEVLYIAMEQGRLELVCKSLARTAYLANAGTRLTAHRIRNKVLTAQEEAEVQQAIALYKDRVKDRVSILEGNFGFSIKQIAEAVKGYIARTGKRPVVIVDYLQILRPSEKAQTTKETVDSAITELKTLSRDFGLCIIAISSVNRANYLYSMDLDSLKESGGIEYTADAVFFLQLRIMQDKAFDGEGKINEKRKKIKEAKAANPREVQLICLKNRFGTAAFDCDFEYFPASDLFSEEQTRLDIDYYKAR